MEEKEVQRFRRYIFWGAIASLMLLSYFVIKPFIIPIISAFILAYLTKPLHNYLSPKIGKGFSALISVVLVIIIIIIPLIAIIGGILNQATDLLDATTINTLFQEASQKPLLQKLNIDLATLAEKGLSLLIALLTSSISLLPSIILTLFITLFGLYYILISWDSIALKLEKYLPFENKKRIRKEMSQITNTIVYGTILVALVEFIIAFNGFFISGVGPYLLFPLLIFFLAFIPGLGPTIVWLPLSIYYVITGNTSAAIGVLITGLILSILIDTVLRAKLLGDKVKLNPLIMLVGILGGISLFGIFGFIIGPLILIYTKELLEEILMNE
jgi:predicted PurR-regulated permease PerM